ncbi:unnamed protein product [Prorocentrum cordatum]|uniref:Uncharacterized protein n=1 Tax=Prorocentrum cordatum TaxID=2364126 RepID=A0ABN9S6W7_9DINO|nr:unnamed protein product [Polarella glacialis]
MRRRVDLIGNVPGSASGSEREREREREKERTHQKGIDWKGISLTRHAFNDHNHCDLTAMLGDVSHNENDGSVDQIAVGNLLGPGIEVASLPELGPGGSWSTCTNGCHTDPPRDVAHVQFRSRIAFKLVWCPPDFESFVLVDDAGGLLARGRPGGALPQEGLRAANYALVRGSKYAKEAEAAVE